MQQQLEHPQQFIRQWRKFSQGLAGKPSPYEEPVFHFEGRYWHGLPLYFGRMIPGYLEVGDEVLCFGHGPRAGPECLTYDQVSQYDQYDWLNTPGEVRHDWPDDEDLEGESYVQTPICRVSRILEEDDPGVHDAQITAVSGWWVTRACLALPIELHYKRRQQLQSEGRWIEWADRPELAVPCVSGSSIGFDL